MLSIDASMKSRSVFERIASFQPRVARLVSADGTSGNTGQAGQRLRERVVVVDAEARRNLAHDLAILQRRLLRLNLRLELVVAREQLVADDGADPRVPVDEGAVAVERRPSDPRR